MICSSCPEPHPLSWVDERFGCKRDRLPAMRIAHGLKNDGHDYRDDLARYAGDPQARVSGPRDVARLIDQRKREGWQFHKDWSSIADNKGPELKPSEQIVREAFEAAKARQFQSDNNGG